jgi:hypothetical protein
MMILDYARIEIIDYYINITGIIMKNQILNPLTDELCSLESFVSLNHFRFAC